MPATHRCFACFVDMARPGCWPTYEPDSAVRDLRWVAAGIVALLLVAWGSGGLS